MAAEACEPLQSMASPSSAAVARHRASAAVAVAKHRPAAATNKFVVGAKQVRPGDRSSAAGCGPACSPEPCAHLESGTSPPPCDVAAGSCLLDTLPGSSLFPPVLHPIFKEPQCKGLADSRSVVSNSHSPESYTTHLPSLAQVPSPQLACPYLQHTCL